MATKKAGVKSKTPKEVFVPLLQDGSPYGGEFYGSIQEVLDSGDSLDGDNVARYQLVGTGTIKSTFVENK